MKTIRTFCLYLLALSALHPATASGRDGTLTVTHEARSLQPGEAILLRTRSTVALKKLSMEAFDREFETFTEDGGLTWTGLAGIDLDTQPGSYTIKVTGIDGNGGNHTGSRILVIQPKEFPTRRLTVDEKYVTPPEEVLSRITQERERVNAIFSSVTPSKIWQGPFRLPVPGKVISAFGKRSVYNGQPRSPHTGVDFRGAKGTLIRAPNAGLVAMAADLYYSGNTVILDHGYGLYSYFGHMSAISVKEGDRVKAGGVIGKVGATGVVTGPHLHWTIRLAGSRIDPLSLVDLLKGKKD